MPNRQRPLFFTTARFVISAILFRVRNSFRFAAFLFVAGASILVAPLKPAQPALQASTQSPPQQVQQPTPGPQQAVSAQAGSQQVPPPIPIHTGPVIVLDAAHGGMDSGARGQNGLVEKDIVLLFARITRFALERDVYKRQALLGVGYGVLNAGDKPPMAGTVAPDFTLNSQEGTPVNLHDYRGKWVVLYFYPKDFTSGCTTEAHNFQRDLAQYQAKGVTILGVSADSAD